MLFELAFDPENGYMVGNSPHNQHVLDGKPDFAYSVYGLMNNTWKQMLEEGRITQVRVK